MYKANVIFSQSTKREYCQMAHHTNQGITPLVDVSIADDVATMIISSTFQLSEYPKNSTSKKRSEPKNRLDVYLPPAEAIKLGCRIVNMLGVGELAPFSDTNPQKTQKGGGVLPNFEPTLTKYVLFDSYYLDIAGFVMKTNEPKKCYIEAELADKDHKEMSGFEVHVAFALPGATGSPNYIEDRKLAPAMSSEELKKADKYPPIFGIAEGNIKIGFPYEEMKKLGLTLLRKGLSCLEEDIWADEGKSREILKKKR